jgi:alpha/beta superfamily hydrolase
MAQLEAVEIPAPHGRLEGLLRRVDSADAQSAAPPRLAALVCHPHPQGGGTMHNKVVFRIAQALGELGMPTLRFNYRGVGRSSGSYDAGRGEADDVRTALDYLAALYPGVPLCLAGFSFGAWIGLPVGCADTRVRQLIGVGVPVRLLAVDELARCAAPKLVIQGERDEHGPLEALRSWYGALPGPKRLVVVPGADHFFTDHQEELRAAILAYFRG